MNILKAAIFFIIFSSCYMHVEVKKKYEEYFDTDTYNTLLRGFDAYNSKNHLLADTLFTIVINNSKDKLSTTMPIEFNPYYYRGHNNIEIDKYGQAIEDFEHVASDTTTNTDILLARTEAFKMLSKYDTAIVLCNRLLALGVDSSVVLSQRGACYYQKEQRDKACEDFRLSKQLAKEEVAFLDELLKKCE